MNIDFARHSSDISAFRAYGRDLRSAEPEISIAGVVLLSALAVALTIIGVVMLGGMLVAAWWLISHIPLPPVVWRVLAFAGL